MFRFQIEIFSREIRVVIIINYVKLRYIVKAQDYVVST